MATRQAKGDGRIPRRPIKVLVVDVGGTKVKILVNGKRKARKVRSGPNMTARQMVEAVQHLAGDWSYDVVSLGYPGAVRRGRPADEPKNLSDGWVRFDFEKAFGCPVKVINDAAMQALGSYEGGRMLFLGLGTGLGSALITDGVLVPMELAHLRYRKGRTYEDYVGLRGLKRYGKRNWRRYVAEVVTALRDALQAANSGHPGTPMALAPVAYCLWQHFLRFDPEDPIWPNRDRFILSNGHASMLLYSILHLCGVKAVNPKYEVLGQLSVSLEDIKRFRQLDSKCPGHPEYRWTSGVETTTGPLGQGVATSVGIALAGRWMATYFNRPGFEMFDYDVFAVCGDGCLMEGISGEAASLAGHLKLSNLCWIYDNNKITIEGHTELAFSEDVATRFIGYGWNVTRVGDANDLEMLERAIRTFKNTDDRPTLIIVDSHIAYGAPNKQDTSAAHGEPLGEEEIRLTKRAYGWPEDAKFLVPDGVREHFQEGVGKRGRALREAWMARFNAYKAKYPELADHLYRMQTRQLPEGWDKDLPSFPPDAKGKATRDTSGQVLNAMAKNLPWLIGGSADLAPSTKTRLTFEGAGDFLAENHAGRNLHFGIREHAMGAILNGMSLAKVRPYGSTFLIFSDYGRHALRLSALMEIPVIYVFTHDSIGLGEDGPTHQPVEQLASLRAIPGLITLRPADANEAAEAWKFIAQLRHEPVALVLTRQAVPTLDRTKYASAEGVKRGAYVLADADDGKPDVLLLATGSEVSLCVNAYEQLKTEGIKARVVSMPSWEIFEYYCSKHADYRERVLPAAVTARVSVEQATTFGWQRYVGPAGHIIGMHTFGASAPLKALQTKFGFTPDNVAAAAKEQLKLARKR